MIYSNDESDKSVRWKNFFLTVFVLPVVAALIMCSLIYVAAKENYLSQTDRVHGYLLSVCAGLLLYGFNKRNWLKTPDGTYHNIKGITPPPKIRLDEPGKYEEEYFYSKKKKVISTFSGLLAIGGGIFIIVQEQEIILVPIAMVAVGLFLTYTGIKELLDKTAKLKLAKKGLWTPRLGFVDWNDIAKAQVIQDTSGRTPQPVLEIYLKTPEFDVTNHPDERLYLTGIENNQYIEMIIDNLMSKRNELKR